MSDPHRTIEALLSAYLDGELDRAHRRMVEDHLAGCAGCRRELAELRAADTALAALAPPPAAPELRQALRGRLRRETTRTVLTGAFAALPVLTLRSLLPELAGLRRGDFPLWFRLLRALGNGLVLSSLTGLCLELLRDVRTLVEYAWLSGEPVERGDEE